jgi:hypothetical protein
MKEENLNIKSIITLNALYTEFMNVSGIHSDKMSFDTQKLAAKRINYTFIHALSRRVIGAYAGKVHQFLPPPGIVDARVKL